MTLKTRARRSLRIPYRAPDTALSIFSIWLVMKNHPASYGGRVTRRKPLTRVTSFSTPCPKTVVVPQRRERSFHRTTSRDRTYLIYLLPRASPTNPCQPPPADGSCTPLRHVLEPSGSWFFLGRAGERRR